jgi:hypothetical protein
VREKSSSVWAFTWRSAAMRKPAGARGGVLHHLARLRVDQGHDGVDERTRREVLPRARLHLAGVLLQQPFVEVAEALFAGAVPVELVDLAHQLREVGGLAQGVCASA